MGRHRTARHIRNLDSLATFLIGTDRKKTARIFSGSLANWPTTGFLLPCPFCVCFLLCATLSCSAFSTENCHLLAPGRSSDALLAHLKLSVPHRIRVPFHDLLHQNKKNIFQHGVVVREMLANPSIFQWTIPSSCEMSFFPPAFLPPTPISPGSLCNWLLFPFLTPKTTFHFFNLVVVHSCNFTPMP